jgi:hypothetical protein
MTDVPNLLGFVFVLKSSSNKPDHTLTILSQNFTSAEFASIQGTWQGDGPSHRRHHVAALQLPRPSIYSGRTARE